MSGRLGSSVWSGDDPGSQVMSDEVRSQRSRQLWAEDPALYAWVSEITAMPPLARSLQTGDLDRAWRTIDDDPEELDVLVKQTPFSVVGLLDRDMAERQKLAEDPAALHAAILAEQGARHQRFRDSARRLMAGARSAGRSASPRSRRCILRPRCPGCCRRSGRRIRRRRAMSAGRPRVG